MPRCAWSNVDSPNVREIDLPVPNRFGKSSRLTAMHVLPEHEEQLRAWVARVTARARLFLWLVSGATVLTILAGAAFDLPGLGLGLAGLGAVIVALPFATPETSAALGVAKSIRIPRVSGIALVVAGLLIAGLSAA